MNGAGSELSAFLSAIIGLAILSVLLSSNAQTAGVISALSTGVSGLIGAATKPVTG